MKRLAPDPRRSGDTTGGRKNRLAYLGSLAGGLAHEIKNPLSAMSVNLQRMREDLERSSQARDARLLKRVGVLEREVRRLEEILDGFLNFARGYSLEPTPTSINTVLREVAEFWAGRAQSQGVDVELVLGEGLPEVLVDATYFKQSLLNLLNNALDAILGADGEKNGQQIVIGSRPAKGGVDVLVIDSGPGIPEEMMARIFEPYVSTKKGGSGLGLPTARRIVEEHGGTLTVQSEPGRGTSFRIFLPETKPDR